MIPAAWWEGYTRVHPPDPPPTYTTVRPSPPPKPSKKRGPAPVCVPRAVPVPTVPRTRRA